MQATDPATDDLVVALFRVMRRLKALRSSLPVENGALPLLHLLTEPDRQRLSDLAAAAGLDISTTSRHVRSLEEAGLVERAIDPDDRRATRLSVTRAGRTELRRARELRNAMLRDATRRWSDADRARLTRLLQQLADDLTTTTDPTTDQTTEATTTR